MEIKVDVEAAIQDLIRLEEDARKAVNEAVREAAERVAKPAMQAAVSYIGPKAPIGRLGTKTGKLRSQVNAKYWIGKRDGLLNAAIKVIGDRKHVAALNEKGTLSHGRVPGSGKSETRTARRFRAAQLGRSALPARRMFALTGAAIRPELERLMVASFERHLKAK